MPPPCAPWPSRVASVVCLIALVRLTFAADTTPSVTRPATPPATRPAASQPATVASPWGKAVAGLRARVVGPESVEKNSWIGFSLELQADPDHLPRGVTGVNTYLFPNGLRLTLTDPATGESVTVTPPTEDGPSPQPDDGGRVVKLGAEPVGLPRATFPLVTAADRLPPGAYDVVVSYKPPRSPGGQKGAPAGAAATPTWEGEIVSGPLRLRILPEVPRTRTLLLPRRLHLDPDRDVRYSREDAEEVVVPVRNGYTLGTKITHEPEDQRMGVFSGPPVPAGGDRPATGIEFWSADMEGVRKISFTIEVFETAEAPHHIWVPGPGAHGYKTLWKKTLDLAPTDAELRAQATGKGPAVTPAAPAVPHYNPGVTRLLITADLHYDHGKSRGSADELIDRMNAAGGDVLLVVGDTSAADGDALERCLARFGCPGPKLFVAGNHELWTGGTDSYELYTRVLPARAGARLALAGGRAVRRRRLGGRRQRRVVRLLFRPAAPAYPPAVLRG